MSEQQPNFWRMLLAMNAWPMQSMETTRSQGTSVPWPQAPAPELRSSKARASFLREYSRIFEGAWPIDGRRMDALGGVRIFP